MNKIIRRPSNKVTAGVLAGAITVIASWAFRQFVKVELPPEVAMAGQVVITFLVQYVVPDAEPEEQVEEQPVKPDPLLADTQPVDRP